MESRRKEGVGEREMTEYQRLFFVQARSNYDVFELLRVDDRIPRCHALHYLQMATELLAKAFAWKEGRPSFSHRAFAGFLKGLRTNRPLQRKLGYGGQNQHWAQVIRKSYALAEGVEALAPTIAKDGPNPEYPWPRDAPCDCPAEFDFPIWRDLQQTAGGRQFLQFVNRLFAKAGEDL
jgi:hypothetical protein